MNSANDMKKLKMAIINQSMDDYIKMQHPKYRSKKYLEEAFLYSVCMFFDPSYTFQYFLNDDGSNQTSLQFISTAMDRNLKNLDPMKKHLKESSIKHWNKKYMKTFTIPSYLVFEGIVYKLLMSENKQEIDYDNQSVYFDKKTEDSEKIFIQMFTEITDKEFELKLTKKQKQKLSYSIYNLLKMNKLYVD